MSELNLLTTIIDRQLLPKLAALYEERNLFVSLITLGHGTVTGDTASLFLNRAEKAVVFSFITTYVWKDVKRALRQNLQIDIPGVGVAFTVPMSSIGGPRELAFLTEGQNFQRGGESEMLGTERELIVVMCDQGNSEMVMDAAREAGALGGTVIHARGTGNERSERFFGFSLASEKDMIFIVTKTARRDRIMQAVMLKAGMETPARSIVFSLPVTDTAGLRLEEDDIEPAAAETKTEAQS